jgi:hypothetical protein
VEHEFFWGRVGKEGGGCGREWGRCDCMRGSKGAKGSNKPSPHQGGQEGGRERRGIANEGWES